MLQSLWPQLACCHSFAASAAALRSAIGSVLCKTVSSLRLLVKLLRRDGAHVNLYKSSLCLVMLCVAIIIASFGWLQALATFGDEIGIAFSGAEDVALVEYAHLTGRPFRVFRCVSQC